MRGGGLACYHLRGFLCVCLRLSALHAAESHGAYSTHARKREIVWFGMNGAVCTERLRPSQHPGDIVGKAQSCRRTQPSRSIARLGGAESGDVRRRKVPDADAA